MLCNCECFPCRNILWNEIIYRSIQPIQKGSIDITTIDHHLPRLIQNNLAGEENDTKNVTTTAE